MWLANNETFHRLLTEGVPVSIQKDGDERGERVWLVDFDYPSNNDFLVVNQFTIVENNHNRRPDLILFVNGLPLVVIELKIATDPNATVLSAFKQLETYKSEIPSLFTFNALNLPGVKQLPRGDRKAGVVWHTQGSGKSLSMVFYTGKIVLAMQNSTVLVITDRNDLDDQLFDTFASAKQLLRQEPVQASKSPERW